MLNVLGCISCLTTKEVGEVKYGTYHYSGQEAIERQIKVVLDLVLCIVLIFLLEMLYSNALLDHHWVVQ